MHKFTRINKVFESHSKEKAMKTKLTLMIEQSTNKKAKKYAQQRRRSLSSLIQNYLKASSNDEVSAEDEFSPTVSLLKGSFKQTQKLGYKEELVNRLSEKYRR